jgi:tetratricopeptide (TPR) repeat protein
MAELPVHRHPLAALRASLGDLSASAYLDQVDRRHRELGFGTMATRREKVARWESGVCAPEPTAQLAMASLHGVSPAAVRELGWPRWLLLAFDGDHDVLAAPWTLVGTVTSMTATVRGGAVDRRGFLIVTGSALAALTGDWAQATARAAPVTATGGRRRLTTATVAHLEQRLDHLRRLDDSLGGRDLLRVADGEFELIGTLASGTVYNAATGQRLFSALSEAGRICGWLHFDQGYQAAAQKYYLTALRASATATAGDPETGANVLAFMAIQAYSAGDPRDAVALGQAAQEQVTRQTTPRVRAILHARTARALSKTPGAKAGCARELTAARDAVAAGPSDDDPAWSYWVTPAEIEMLAGSCALDVGDPRQALRCFDAARDADYNANGYIRDNALFLTRAAEAHLALGNVTQACGLAGQALAQNTDIESARPAGAIASLRQQLQPYQSVPEARDFLELSRT